MNIYEFVCQRIPYFLSNITIPACSCEEGKNGQDDVKTVTLIEGWYIAKVRLLESLMFFVWLLIDVFSGLGQHVIY